MKGQVAATLIVVALITGSGIGYFARNTSAGTTTEMVVTTETVVSTYTVTLPGSGLLSCVVTEYSVWVLGYGSGGVATSYSTTTEQTPVSTYTSSTTATQAVGFTTVSTSPYGGTVTGALARGNYTTCTYAPG